MPKKGLQGPGASLNGELPPLQPPVTVAAFLAAYEAFEPREYDYVRRERQALVVRLAGLCLSAVDRAEKIGVVGPLLERLAGASATLRRVEERWRAFQQGELPAGEVLLTEEDASVLPTFPAYLVCEMAVLHAVRGEEWEGRIDPWLGDWYSSSPEHRAEWRRLREIASAIPDTLDIVSEGLDETLAYAPIPSMQMDAILKHQLGLFEKAAKAVSASMHRHMGKVGKRGSKKRSRLAEDSPNVEVYLWSACGIGNAYLEKIVRPNREGERNERRVKTELNEAKEALLMSRTRKSRNAT